MSDIPAVFDFPDATVTGSSLTLEETTQPFDVAGHEVLFDPQRKLWYCDISIGGESAYAPFVRLALARYQPHSIQGVELSKVVLADYAQLTANRSAFLSIDPADPRHARLAIGGPAPQGPLQNVILVSVEQREPNLASDLGWKDAPPSAVTVTEDAPAPSEPGAALWAGNIVFAKPPATGQFRIVVREFELLFGDSVAILDLPVGRLVYAAILGYDFPFNQPK
jgi:hypothetical protein